MMLLIGNLVRSINEFFSLNSQYSYNYKIENCSKSNRCETLSERAKLDHTVIALSRKHWVSLTEDETGRLIF